MSSKQIIPGNDQKFIHSVYFWLRNDLSSDELLTYREGLQSLIDIENVALGYIGQPASTDRPIIDSTFSYSLVLIFDGQENHDLYQDDPVHEKFRVNCGDFWEKIVIYDQV